LRYDDKAVVNVHRRDTLLKVMMDPAESALVAEPAGTYLGSGSS
jgi:hypothetical protein